MEKHNTSSTSFRSHSKDSNYSDELHRTYLAFQEKPKTMLQVAKQLNIERASICWYVKKLKESNKIAIHRKGICPISKHRAGFLTTDPNKYPDPDKASGHENR